MPEEAVKTDPRLKVMLRDHLMLVVYTDPEAKLQAQLDDLLIKNGVWCVSFRGRIWTMSTHKAVPLPAVVPRPAKSYLPDFAAWLPAWLELEEEKRLASGAITAVLNAVTDWEDYFELLPACLHEALKQALVLFVPDPKAKALPTDRMAAIKAQQGPYLSLLQQRMVLTLIDV